MMSANTVPPLQPRLSHLLHEEEGSERFGRSEQAGVSFWMVREAHTLLPNVPHFISPQTLIQSLCLLMIVKMHIYHYFYVL